MRSCPTHTRTQGSRARSRAACHLWCHAINELKQKRVGNDTILVILINTTVYCRGDMLRIVHSGSTSEAMRHMIEAVYYSTVV